MATASKDRFSDAHALPISGTVADSATRTATSTWQVDIRGGRTITFVIGNITKVGSAPSVVFSVCGQDPVSGAFFTILDSAAVVATGSPVTLVISEFITAVTNKAANFPVPERIFITANHSNTDGLTYSLGAIVAP